MSDVRLLFSILRDHLRASSRAHRDVVFLVFAMIFGLVISVEDMSVVAIAAAATAGALITIVGVLLLPAAIFLCRSVTKAKERREPLARYVGSPSYCENLDSSLRF